MPVGEIRVKPQPKPIDIPPIPQPEPPKPMPTEAVCSFDLMTSITKILTEAQATMGFKFEPKAIRVDLKDDRKQKIEEHFQKAEPQLEESKELLGGQEEEDENMMQSAIILRRGRCGRLFAKYIQKSIFEDSDGNSTDLEDDFASERKGLKKRRKRYQDLQQYLRLDGSAASGTENLIYQGLLLRDKKYLQKNMQKVTQLSVKESANKIVRRRVA